MKALKLALMMVFFTAASSFSYAQVIDSEEGTNPSSSSTSSSKPIRKPVDRPWSEQNLADNKPVTLQYISKDYLYKAKFIWRVLDLREKMNHPLYFPTEERGNRRSLMQIILNAVDSSEENPKPLMVYTDENINIPVSPSELKNSMGETKRIEIINDWGEVIGDSVIFIGWSAKDVFQYVIKECCFIDNQRSMMDWRIMAICPMFWYEPQTDAVQEESDDDMPAVTNRRWRQFSWIDYNEFRPFMAKNEAFNMSNFAQNRSFDDVFLQRRFASFIKAEDNVYNDREINHYIVNGLDQILESERIKDKIRQFENDIWDY